jgi:hypothetical protein
MLAVSQTACYEQANEGELKVQVVRGQITRIIRPADGWVNTMSTVGDEYYPFNIRTFTFPLSVNGSTKDNAAVKIDVSLTVLPPTDDEGIKRFVREFGLDESERWQRMTSVLNGQANTETKNAVANYEAYGLLANQEAIQATLFAKMQPILKQQLNLTLQSIQIIGRPDFLDDRIETAASNVVANQKLKEAAEAALAASRVESERKQIEALSFANPALLQIKLLELQLDIEKERAKGIAAHQGTLIIGNQPVQVQIPSTK